MKSVFLCSMCVAGSFAAMQSGCYRVLDDESVDAGSEDPEDALPDDSAPSRNGIGWGPTWCGSHHDDGTLFCNDFDNGGSELALNTDTPPGPWSNHQEGAGGFEEGLSITSMPNSRLSSFNVTVVPLPKDVSTFDELITTQEIPTTPVNDPRLGPVNSPTGVILTFDLHIENYLSSTQDLSLVQIGSHDGTDPQLASWWVSLDYNTNVMELCEFGIQTPGSPATALQCFHSTRPDFTVAGWYHCTLAVDFVLGNAWWVYDPAPSTAIDAGPGFEDDAGDAADDSGFVSPLIKTNHASLKTQLIYFQGSTYPAVLPNSGTAMDVIIGLNYAVNVSGETGIYYDNVRVEAVPPEGLPSTGPTFPADDAGW